MQDEDECYKLHINKTGQHHLEYIPEDIEDYFMKVGYPVNTLFKECAFATESLNCADLVEEVFDRNYGKCFLLKNEKFFQKVPGIGLSLVLDLDTKNAYSLTPPLFDGVVIKVESDFDLAGYKKVLLQPAKYTVLNLQARKYDLIQRDRPIGGSQVCRDPDEGQNNLHVIKSPYTLGTCRMDCVQEAILEECRCVLPMSKKYIKPELFESGKLRKDPFCTLEVMKKCAYPLILRVRERNELRECDSKCHVPCRYWEYMTETSFARFPSLMLLNNPASKINSKKKIRKRQTVHENEEYQV